MVENETNREANCISNYERLQSIGPGEDFGVLFLSASFYLWTHDWNLLDTTRGLRGREFSACCYAK